jgi:hypothetical protein
MNARRRTEPEPLVAMFVAAGWAAASFGASGLLAVVLDRDPVEADVPRLAGILTLVLAGVVVWIVVTVSARAPRVPWPSALGAASAVYFLYLLAGFVLGAPVLVEQATSPFVIVSALLAGVAVLATWAVVRRVRRGR